MAKEKKAKKIKQEKYRSEEQTEMIRFIRILIIVIIFVLAIYFLTRIFVTKDLFNNNDDNETQTVEGTINYNVTSIGSMLNKAEDEYYVLIFNTDDLRAIYYSGLMSNYTRGENALKVYYADLKNELNQKFYDPENINLEVSGISDLRVGDLTLVKVSNGQITEILSNEDEIASELAYIAPEDVEN